MPETQKNIQLSTRDQVVAAQTAELLLGKEWREADNRAVEDAEEDGELYREVKRIAEQWLAQLALILTGRGEDRETDVWRLQHSAAMADAYGERIGPYYSVLSGVTMQGRGVMARESTGNISHLTPGEPEVVTTNSGIVARDKIFDDPVEFIDDALSYVQSRRQRGGSKFEGPENYATILKKFSDKASEDSLFASIRLASKSGDDTLREHVRSKVDDTIVGFLRTANRDEPNLVEVTNILSAIRAMPAGIIDPRYTQDLLKHSASVMEEFAPQQCSLYVAAISKLDTSENPEFAARTLDLALRKGGDMHRSGDLLTALRAISSLEPTPDSRQAFHTVLQLRNTLEIAINDLGTLAQTSGLLYEISKTSTADNPEDAKAAKEIAEYIALKAAKIYHTRTAEDGTDQGQRTREMVSTIVAIAKSM